MLIPESEVISLKELFFLGIGGLLAGAFAGLFGVGGGIIFIPVLTCLGFQPSQALATSTLAISITASAASVQNIRRGAIGWKPIFQLGLPAILVAPLGVHMVNHIQASALLLVLGTLQLINFVLIARKGTCQEPQPTNLAFRILLVGGISGLIGIGGGIIPVALQIVYLQAPVKAAIQTSLGVLALTAIVASEIYVLGGRASIVEGLILGVGGVSGSQVSSLILLNLPESIINNLLRVLMIGLSLYFFAKAGVI